MKFRTVQAARAFCQKYEEMQKVIARYKKRYPAMKTDFTAYDALYELAKEYLKKKGVFKWQQKTATKQ